MSSPAVGTFEVTMNPEPPYDADPTASIGRVSIKKEFKELLSAIEAQGGTLRKIRNGYQVLAPNGTDIVTLHGTPGGHRTALLHAFVPLQSWMHVPASSQLPPASGHSWLQSGR